MMYRKRLRRRPDPLMLLMVFVFLGLTATISYQLLFLVPADRGEMAVQPSLTTAAGVGS
ncbi:hypothetical protein GWK36_08400 [Caldichromatium japonicum]|uniref:Uncharacterized protein n=1 Tax=Caldichromatium japonicum TaxID=2699430 RepID=A0A6G7VDH1_9GAMM|nr:hypothetical protein [Caldichromatium japonicum]QIK38002.1 hypothetical protein GWK36_08400 [Caldichromatium japonicum]